jgi:hypothetical protein
MKYLIRFLFIVAASLPLAWSSNAKSNSGSQSQTTTIKQVNKNAQSYLDKRVTLTGEVEKVYNPKIFTLDGPGFLNDELLVVISGPSKVTQSDRKQAGTQGNVVEDAQVQVTGTVKRMALADIERVYGFNLDPKIEVEVERAMPVLITDAKDVIHLEQTG